MNETTENFIKALSEFDPGPDPVIVIKLTYDAETGRVTGCTFEDTDQPFVEITREQWNKDFHHQRLKIVDGKPVVIERKYKRELALVPGDRWHTDRSNMLIIGRDRGWNERKDS